MRAVDIIMKKRDGLELSRSEIEFLINGYVKGEIPEYQISSWAMSVYFKGMTFAETAALTDVMLHSGKTMDLTGLTGPFVDKHSTGGVGDKVSLILAPIVAACGIKDPMMSGRSLGHTGGTLDKLDSIPGYRTLLSDKEFRDFIGKDGFAMTGQTAEIVPADKKLYALRDVTATVESVPLITASILSKKVAEGADALVFDVKAGVGAFMKNLSDAERLATSLVQTGKAMGKKVVGVITAMDEPLGLKTGNFLEVEESIDCLLGKGPEDLMEVTYRLSAWMLVAGGKAKTVEEGIELCKEAITSGRAYERFLANVKTQGGDVDAMLKLVGKCRSKFVKEFKASASGYVQFIDAYKCGMASVYLGAGRSKTDDPVYPDVGLIFVKKAGDAVKTGDLMCTIYGKDAASVETAEKLLTEAYVIGAEKPSVKPLILKEITAL